VYTSGALQIVLLHVKYCKDGDHAHLCDVMSVSLSHTKEIMDKDIFNINVHWAVRRRSYLHNITTLYELNLLPYCFRQDMKHIAHCKKAVDIYLIFRLRNFLLNFSTPCI
jgi:hypothetical protein